MIGGTLEAIGITIQRGQRRVWRNRLQQAARTSIHLADLHTRLDRTTITRLRELCTPRLAAALTIALITGLPPSALAALNTADITPDGSAVNRAGEWFAVPAHAQALIRALLIERAGDDVNPQAPLFTGRSDSRIVEAAIVRHGGGATREDLALALKWPLERLELALRTLERRLQATGLGLAKQAGTAHAGAIGDRGVRGD